MPKENITVTGEPGDSLAVEWGRNDKVRLHVTADLDALAYGDDTITSVHTYLVLGRASVNHLIRVLRKARDSAYGADA